MSQHETRLVSATPGRPTVLLRADRSSQMGLGHFMRSATLARAMQQHGWDATLCVSRQLSGSWEDAFQDGVPVVGVDGAPGGEEDAREILALGADLVVVDGYHFSEQFFRSLTDTVPFMVIDDNGESKANGPAAILNQNPHVRPSVYADRSGTPVLLLGLRYALVRQQIITAGPVADRRPGRVLISMGGSDVRGITGPIATLLSRLGHEVAVVIASLDPRSEALRHELANCLDIELVRADELASAMAMSEVAVIGGGTTMWEAAYLGVPSIAVVVADNQRVPASAADDLGFACSLDATTLASASDVANAVAGVVAGLLADRPTIGRMSQLGRSTVDGHGAARVAEVLTKLHLHQQRTPPC